MDLKGWTRESALEVGKALFQPLPPSEVVERAGAVLRLCRARWSPVPAVESVAAVAAEPARWKEGHGVFGSVRTLTLREDETPTNRVYAALLYVAEIVAKIIYNATDPPDPFDEDSAGWLASVARSMADVVGDPDFERAVWGALNGG